MWGQQREGPLWTEQAEKAPQERWGWAILGLHGAHCPWIFSHRRGLGWGVVCVPWPSAKYLTRGCKDAGVAKGVGNLWLKAISFGLLAPIPSHHENLFFLLLNLFLLHFVFLSFLSVLSQVKPQTGQGPSGSRAVTRGSSKGASFQILRMSHSLGPWCHSLAQASVMLRESLCCWYSHTWCPSGSWWVLIGVWCHLSRRCNLREPLCVPCTDPPCSPQPPINLQDRWGFSFGPVPAGG